VQRFEVHSKKEFFFPNKEGEKQTLNFFISDYEIAVCRLNHQNEALAIYSAAFNGNVTNPEVHLDAFRFFIANFGLNGKTYQKVNAMVLNRHFVLCPKAYNSKEAREMLEFNLGQVDIPHVHQYLIHQEISFTYAALPSLIQLIEKEFVTTQIYHAGTVSIDLFLKLPAFSKSNIFVCLHRGYMEIVIKQGQSLKMYNVFEWNNREDVLYYILFSMEQFGLQPALESITISAEMETTDPLFAFLKKYIREIGFFTAHKITQTTSQVPHHYYFHVLNKHLCAF